MIRKLNALCIYLNLTEFHFFLFADNTLYIIIACVVTLLLIVIVVVLIVVVCLKKNNTSSILPQPFLVHDRKTEPRKTQLTHSKVALPVPITPPLNTVMSETNLFDLDLPDKETGRGNRLPPLHSTTLGGSTK
jgi:hypothetical protein